jgi:hypothetical protein
MDIDPLSRLSMRSGGDKFGSHMYTPIYHSLFRDIRHLPIKLLEIGIGGHDDPRVGGSSLRTWAAYFPRGQIVGLDISAKRLGLPENITVYRGSQSDPTILAKINAEHGPFDIIIDDASHINELTLASLMILYPTMSPLGFYVVEDTQTAFRPNTGGNAQGKATIFEAAHRVGLAMHRAEGFSGTADGDRQASAGSGGLADDATWSAFGAITEAVMVYRNLICFRRGDNSYPSNVGLDFQHPEVRRNYALMERMSEENPSPRDSLARIDMNVWAGRTEEAAKLALLTAARYPDDADLLHELRFMMKWANRPTEQQIIHERLQALGEA